MECALCVGDRRDAAPAEGFAVGLGVFQCRASEEKEESFRHIAEACQDIGDHIHKGPSHIELTFCTDDENMCDKCKEILAKRQLDEPTWHPKTLLAPLAFNAYLIPWPVPEETEPDQAEITAADVEKAVVLEARIAALRLLLDRAVKGEDYLEAGRLKQELSSVCASRPSQSSEPSSSAPGANSELTAQVFRAVTASHEHEHRPRYMIFQEVLRHKSRPEVIDVPISAYAKRLEGVHKCPECSFYLAKSEGELAHHLSNFHGKVRKRRAEAPAAVVAASSWEGFSVAGMAPVEEPPKKKSKAAGSQDLDEEPVDGEGPADDEGDDDVDGHVDWMTEPPERLCRNPAAQCTPDEIKSMRPLANGKLGVGLYVDRLAHHRYTTKYPNDTQLRHVSPDVIEALPDHLKPGTQSFTFGKHASNEDEEAMLEEALKWLWEKREYLYEEARPEWTKPALMEVELDGQ